MLSWKHWLLISVSLDKEYTTPLCQVRALPLKYLKFLVSIIIVYVCMHAMIRLWRSEDNSVVLSISFHVGSGRKQVIRLVLLVSECHHSVSPLISAESFSI